MQGDDGWCLTDHTPRPRGAVRARRGQSEGGKGQGLQSRARAGEGSIAQIDRLACVMVGC